MKRTPGFWFALVATAVVLASVVAGLLATGGPGEARLEKLDEARRSDLRAIETTLRNGWRRGQATPEILGDDRSGLSPGYLRDPETGEPYGYRALSDTAAEVCATFARAYDRRSAYLDGSAVTAHPAGRACFTLSPDPDF